MKKIILDKYEQEIEDALARGEFHSVPKKEFEEEKIMLQEAAKRFLELKKSKSITLRVKNENLIKFKVKAEKKGIPYQRIINTFIDQYANDEIRITI
jgi:predicted DNA binding CopG/RHH family protein